MGGANEMKKLRMNTRIGMLRQWLNEDRITDSKKMVTNEDIEDWLGIVPCCGHGCCCNLEPSPSKE